jgi:hypothetical protein
MLVLCPLQRVIFFLQKKGGILTMDYFDNFDDYFNRNL